MSLLNAIIVLMIGLKLCGVVNSWWYAGAPMILEALIIVILAIWKSIDPVGYIRFWKT